jgi:hypothetical protein
MPCSVFRFGVLLALLALSLPGCGYFQGAETDADDEFADFDRDDEADKKEESGELARDPKSAEGELELKLKQGDRFPLKKRTEQVLTQGDGLGGMLVNRSIVEMLLSLVVEEVRDGSKHLSVRYHKVHYAHNIAGRQVEYNSEKNEPVPNEALLYAGLKDNGFSFWIGPDNRVTELVGFQDFLQRCLQNVPPAYRDSVMRQLEGTHSDDGLANFVDDGIGLLPYSDDPRHPAVAVRVGSAWELKPRRTEGPIPMNVTTRCVLKSLTETSAEIGLFGNIVGSSAPVVVREGPREMRILFKSGRCMGTCTVDRRTGLPTQSEVNRVLEMTVQLPDGKEIPQRKEVLTSITSFLDQSGMSDGTQRDAEYGPLTRASAFGQGSAPNRITQAGGTDSPLLDDRRSDSRSRSGSGYGSAGGSGSGSGGTSIFDRAGR